MGSRRKLGVGWLAVLVGVALLVGTVPALGQWSECPDCCFEDVVVSGAGAWWANERYEYDEYAGELHYGRPVFDFESAGGVYSSGVVYYREGSGATGWFMEAVQDWGGYDYCWVLYYNPSSALTPPSTGWVLDHIYSDECGDIDGLPAPRLSGGEPCGSGGGEIVPGGLEGFLDRGWPEGEEPPEVGELVVSATYEVGELISGCCSLVDSSGAPVDASYLTLSWYAVTIGDEFFDVREPIDSRLIYEEEGAFCFSIPTDEFAPGYYDIRLGAPFVDHQWLRVEVVAPAE